MNSLEKRARLGSLDKQNKKDEHCLRFAIVAEPARCS